MTPLLDWLRRTEHEHAPYRDIGCMREELTVVLRRQPHGSTKAELARGQIDGATAGGARLMIDPAAGSIDYRAGYIAGELLAHLYTSAQPLEPRVWLCALRYGRLLVEPGFERLFALPAPANAIKVHRAGWRYAQDKTGPMHPKVWRETFAWLQDALGVVVPPEQISSEESRWQEPEGNVAPAEAAAPPASERPRTLKAIGVRARYPADSVDPAASGTFVLAFGLPDQAWEVARLERYTDSDPLTDVRMFGFFEVLVGEKVVLRRTPASVFAVVCGLARARIAGFPETQLICSVNDSSTGWSLRLVRDPDQDQVNVSEFPAGTDANVPAKAVAQLIDVFLERFVVEASAWIPELTSWGEMRVLSRYVKPSARESEGGNI